MLVMEAMIKGKRTKRRRASPVIHPRLALTLSSGENDGVSIPTATSSSSTSDYNSGSTEEEEDMANCLILLAQGRSDNNHGRVLRNDVVYQCKTCDRVFASFQALGGHRASHKKPHNNNKPNNVDEDNHHFKLVKTTSSFCGDDQEGFVVSHTDLSLQISNRGVLGIKNNSNNKVHECSICGAEFTSGQALGGHMRRHRTTPSFMQQTTMSFGSATPESKPKKPRNVLELDLNLPAVTDAEDCHEENREKMKFPFVGPTGTEQVIVFSASPLVDCHY